MKKYLLVACFMLATLNVAAARQPQLPEVMLGRWCTLYNNYYDKVTTEQDWKECQERDGYLIMRRDGFTGHEMECRFVTITNTGRKSFPHTKPLKHELVSIMRVSARCQEMDGSWYRAAFEIMYDKASLVIIAK